MESSLSEEEGIYHNVIETLYQTFGQVLTRDVICAIVESCYGDGKYISLCFAKLCNILLYVPYVCVHKKINYAPFLGWESGY